MSFHFNAFWDNDDSKRGVVVWAGLYCYLLCVGFTLLTSVPKAPFIMLLVFFILLSVARANSVGKGIFLHSVKSDPYIWDSFHEFYKNRNTKKVWIMFIGILIPVIATLVFFSLPITPQQTAAFIILSIAAGLRTIVEIGARKAVQLAL